MTIYITKQFTLKIILIICVLFLLPFNVYSSSIKEDYDLSERCGKRSEEYFRKEYGNGIVNTDDGQQLSNYQNHYNKKMNKCFFSVISTYISKNKKTNKIESIKQKYLFDINESKEYGSFVLWGKQTKPNDCRVLDNSCNSEGEWDSLIKPYMEE